MTSEALTTKELDVPLIEYLMPLIEWLKEDEANNYLDYLDTSLKHCLALTPTPSPAPEQ